MKERGTKKNSTVKTFEFENTKSDVKRCYDYGEKENISDKSYLRTRGVYLQKLPHVLI